MCLSTLPAAGVTRIKHNKYRAVRCDCTQPARYRVRITLISSTGQLLRDYLDLCPACYDLFLRIEAIAPVAPARRDDEPPS